MKNDLFPADGPELKAPEMKDVDADHSEDSDLLDMIGRDSADPELPQPPLKAKRQIESSSPFLLESLYFQSFGERALLTREEETALAKRIDQGSSARCHRPSDETGQQARHGCARTKALK